MSLKIIKNPDEEQYAEIKQAVDENEGYCPCYPTHEPDRKCMCKAFREQTTPGCCHCGLYIKKEN